MEFSRCAWPADKHVHEKTRRFGRSLKTQQRASREASAPSGDAVERPINSREASAPKDAAERPFNNAEVDVF
jgi:hypothetical protein